MQYKNAELEANLRADYLNRDEFHHNSAKVGDSMMWLNRDGGGTLLWAFDGQTEANYGRAPFRWTENAIVFGNYSATSNGGPYVTLDGAAEYLSVVDDPSQEAGVLNLLVWMWARSNDATADACICSKWDEAGGNWRSWKLHIAGSALTFTCNATGAGGADEPVTSTVTPVDNTFYFVAGFIQASAVQAIGVGAATDTALTYTTASSPGAGVFDGDAGLFVGALTDGGGVGEWWDGALGVGLCRANVPAANIQSHMTRLFASTRWFYQE